MVIKKECLSLLLAAVLPLLALSCSPRSADGPSSVSFDEVLATRRSIRNFDPSKTISRDEVLKIVEAAQDAPSWTNSQSSRYYVALSEERLAAVRELVGERNKQNVSGAPVLLVSTFVKGESGFFRGRQSNELGDMWGAFDNGLNIAYFILKARSMGYDTLIMGGRDHEGLRALFNIPESETVMAVIALGYRAADPVKPARKDVREIIKFF